MKLGSSEIKAVLRMKFAAPEFATLEEVRNATGRLKKRHGKQPRYADMIAMGLWPSSGLLISGFEIKTSRADWLKEISDEKKAVAVQQFCDRWYLVTNSESIVKEGELPDDWGWMVVDADLKVRTIKEAPLIKAAPLTREFLASLMRNATASNPDYVNVQSQIMNKIAEKIPAPRSKSSIKTLKRSVIAVNAAAARKARKDAADSAVAGCSNNPA